nr:MAG TPA: hypothetical protein [Caudoviricetes sp.]
MKEKKSANHGVGNHSGLGRVIYKILYLYCNRNRRKNNEKHG